MTCKCCQYKHLHAAPDFPIITIIGIGDREHKNTLSAVTPLVRGM